MVKINLQDFKPVQLRATGLALRSGANGLVIISGGHLRKEYPLHTKDVKLEGSLSVATFVWIRDWCQWLSYAAMGKKFKAYLLRQGLLKDLEIKTVAVNKRVRWYIERELCLPGDNGVDPMDEMEVETPAGTSDEQIQKNTEKRPFIGRVCRIAMKEWPPEMTPDSPNIDRIVSVYLEGRQQLWLHQDDLPWLIRSLYIQQQVNRVAVVPSDDEGPDAHDSMEDPVTPEKCRQPPKCEGNLHDKGSTAP